MNRAGLTLLELVVALTVAGLAMAAGYRAFSSVIDNRIRIDEATAEVAASSALRQTLTSWLEGARLTADPGGPQFRGLDGVHQGFDDDELTFLTTAETPLGIGESIVRLYVDRDETTPAEGLVAYIAEWRGLEASHIQLDPRVRSVDTRFLSGLLGQRRWLPSWISTTVLPAAVEITLGAEPAESLPPLLEMPLLVAVRGGR